MDACKVKIWTSLETEMQKLLSSQALSPNSIFINTPLHHLIFISISHYINRVSFTVFPAEDFYNTFVLVSESRTMKSLKDFKDAREELQSKD